MLYMLIILTRIDLTVKLTLEVLSHILSIFYLLDRLSDISVGVSIQPYGSLSLFWPITLNFLVIFRFLCYHQVHRFPFLSPMSFQSDPHATSVLVQVINRQRTEPCHIPLNPFLQVIGSNSLTGALSMFLYIN